MTSETLVRIVGPALAVPGCIAVLVFASGRTFAYACLKLGLLVVLSLLFRLVRIYGKKMAAPEGHR
ncbi:hypothetical protein ACYSUO_41830 [Streptomyces sp. UC4497]